MIKKPVLSFFGLLLAAFLMITAAGRRHSNRDKPGCGNTLLPGSCKTAAFFIVMKTAAGND